MEIKDLKAELSVKTIEFELALSNGLPHAEIMNIYRQLKELQYQIALSNVKDCSTDAILE